MNDLVTVYITNKNYSRYIEKAISSVVEQTYPNIEIIVIDDGSEDGSQQLLEDLKQKYKFDLILQEGIGLNKTNNRAILHAKGKYIMRLDADDWLLPECVEALLSKIVETKSALVFPDYFETDAAGQIIKHIQRFDFTNSDILLNSPAHGACTLFAREILLEVGGYNEKFNRQDGVDIWLKIVKKYPVSNLKRPLFYYRQHGNNLTSDKSQLFKVRSEIFFEHTTSEIERKKVVVILPVLGNGNEKRDLSLCLVDGKTVLERKIREIKKSKIMDHIYVTSSDLQVEALLESLNIENVTFIVRPDELSAAHTSLTPTIKWCLEKSDHIRKDVVVVVSTVDYPSIDYFYYDLVCTNLLFFGLECIDTVYPEDSIIYRPEESGLKVLGNGSFIRREREQMYRRAGGVTAYDALCFEDKNFNYLSSRLGHVEIDYVSSIKISTISELNIMSKSLLKGE